MSDIDLETSSFIIGKLKNEKFIENPSIEKIQSSLEEIIKNILSKNKYGKYLAIGGFAFFFIKGLIWLAVIFSIGFSAFNFI